MVTPRQNERFLFGCSVLVLPDEMHVRVEFSPTREGVIHVRSLALSETSSFAVDNRRCNHSVWPCGVALTMIPETCRGLSVGVGIWSACYRHMSVRIANSNMNDGGVGIEEATLSTSPPW